MGRPKDADFARTYQQIVDAALAVLAETGDPQLPMRTVAERAKVSTGTINYYFSSKDELLEACLDSYYERLGAKIAQLIGELGQTTNSREYIEHAAREVYRFGFQERRLLTIRVAIALTDRDGDEGHALVEAYVVRAARRLLRPLDG